MCLTAALDTLTSTGALEKIPTDGKIVAKELAEAVGVDMSVVRMLFFPSLTHAFWLILLPFSFKERAMRIACAQGIGEEPSPDVYTHNEKSLAYVEGTSKWFFKMW